MSAFSAREREVSLHDAPQLVADLPLPVDGRAHARDQLVHSLLEQAPEDRLLGREQLVERSHGELRGPRDLDHGRLLVTLAGVQAPGGSQHVGETPRPLSRLPAGRPGDGGPPLPGLVD